MEVATLLFYLVMLLLTFLFFRHYWEKMDIHDLRNKAVFITGCDTGFGRDLAIKCLERGMPVFAGCLTAEGASSFRDSTKHLKGQLTAFQVDVTSDESVEKAKELLEKETQKYGGLHGVVNNAGIVGLTFFDDMLTIEDYKKTAEVNLWGVIRITHATKSLIKKKKGRIVNVASICGRVGLKGLGPYTVTKFGVEGYSECLRQELRSFGVSVHVVEPGFFLTPLVKEKDIEASLTKVWNKCSPETKEEYGEGFLQEGHTRMNGMIQSIASEHTELVVDRYFHALTASFPRIRYQVGTDAHLLFIPISFLPSRLHDWFMQLSEFVLPGLPVPYSLKRKN